MAQIQFRSDDTTKWGQGFGNGQDGNVTLNAGDAPVVTNFSCSAGALTGVVASATGLAVGQTVFIHQTRGTNAGTHQLNYIIGISGTTITFLYPLVIAFGSIGQLQVMKQYQNITLTSWTIQGWGAGNGGFLAAFANGAINLSGTLNANGGGYIGAQVPAFTNGNQGEGYPGTGSSSTAANGNGGGGNSQPGGGSGGSNGTAGVAGASSNAGAVVGSSDLTSMFFGGGGGSGDDVSGGSGGGTAGGGGGIVYLIGRTITITGALNNNGGNGGSPTGGNHGGDAGGAGGSVLLKGQVVNVGTNLISVAGGTGGAGHGGTGAAGGNGGAGRIHVDYANSFSGSAVAGISTRQDPALAQGFFGGIV